MEYRISGVARKLMLGETMFGLVPFCWGGGKKNILEAVI